jgi:folate-dependent phosphoribosylglycinamide formyltransferase PurN
MAFTKLDWTVFVSQTGKEVYDICNLLNAVPKILVTNNPKRLNEKVATFLKAEGCELKTIPFNPLLEHYLQEDILNSSIITLHGYLRILPGQFIASYSPRTIYNGHPGLITYYEELKGKDPQIRAWEGKYPTVGSVIHKVTEGVDEGEVVRFTAVNNTATSLDEMYDLLRETSLDSWKKFFKENIFKLEN